MILQQYQAVLDGVKTQTRRAWREGEFARVGRLGEDRDAYVIHAPSLLKAVDPVWYANGLQILSVFTPARKLKYAVGHSYAIVPKRGEAAVGRFILLSIQLQRLQQISEADARAEGVQSIAAYRDLWESINGRSPAYRWAADPFVWVYTLKHRNMNYAPMVRAYKELNDVTDSK